MGRGFDARTVGHRGTVWRNMPELLCDGSGRDIDFGKVLVAHVGEVPQRRGPCPVCGRDVSNKPSGKIQRHMPPENLSVDGSPKW